MFAFLFPLLVLSSSAQAATLIFTNDVLGEIEPCGCRVNPFGGMLRKAGLIEKLKKEGKSDFLQVDAGDFFFDSRDVPESLQKQSLLQARALLKAHELLGHQVIVPGEKDFALGIPTLKELISKSKIKFLAANLKLKDQPLLEATANFEFKSKDGKVLKVSILGGVGEDIPFGHDLKVEPLKPYVKKWVEENRKKFDLLILVSHQGLEKDQNLAQEIPGIDFVVGGHSQSFLQAPELVGKTKIVQSSFRNQYIGVLELQTDPALVTHELVGLEEKFETPPVKAMQKLISDFKKDLKKLKAKSKYVFNSGN